jgi:hypothetical protein
LLALFLLAGCSAMDESSRASTGGNCVDWCFGGQTGSLMPVCGVTPNTMSRGVPASGAGIVVLSEPCGDARLLDALTVRDASGRAIPFSVEQLPNGELLIHPENGLTPGSYTVSVQSGDADEDAGADSMPDAGEPVSTTLWRQTVSVQESTALPQLFGTIGRQQQGCSTLLELAPEANVVPYLGLLSVDVQVDSGPVRTLIVTGTMQLQNDGVAREELPPDALNGLPDGEHTLHIVVRLAGESAPLETFAMTLSVPCNGSGATYDAAGETDAGCRAVAPGGARAEQSSAGAAFALFAFALRKRRWRAR